MRARSDLANGVRLGLPPESIHELRAELAAARLAALIVKSPPSSAFLPDLHALLDERAQ